MDLDISHNQRDHNQVSGSLLRQFQSHAPKINNAFSKKKKPNQIKPSIQMKPSIFGVSCFTRVGSRKIRCIPILSLF